MNRLAALAVISLFVCTAASCDTKPDKAIALHCDPICTTKCPDLTGWDGDRDGARLTALFDAHDVEAAACDAHRRACVECLERGAKAGVIQIQ